VCSANPQYSRSRRGEYLYYYCVVILYYWVIKNTGWTRADCSRSSSAAGRPGAEYFATRWWRLTAAAAISVFYVDFSFLFPSTTTTTNTSPRLKQLFFTTRTYHEWRKPANGKREQCNHLNATAVITAPKKTLNYIIEYRRRRYYLIIGRQCWPQPSVV